MPRTFSNFPRSISQLKSVNFEHQICVEHILLNLWGKFIQGVNMTYTNGQTTVDNATKKVSKTMGSLKQQGEGLVQDVKEYAQTEGPAIYERIEDALIKLRSDVSALSARAEDSIGKHPFYAMAGAAVVGICSGLLLRGARRK